MDESRSEFAILHLDASEEKNTFSVELITRPASEPSTILNFSAGSCEPATSRASVELTVSE